jgi:hypothetical protein|tara:strand:+ start:1077 stop:1946 length:870 start_codon:yes stop_codon:yes gene_type:complete
MENEIVEVQEAPKTMMMQRKSRVRERVEQDEAELQQMLEERSGEEKAAEVQAKEDAVPDTAEERSYKKRYADLRRGSQKAKEDLEDRINKLETQLKQSTQQEMRLPKSDEDIDAWANQYPDVAAIVETIAIKKAREQQSGLEDKVKEIDAMRETASRERAEVELLKVHPDFDEIRDSDEFHEWAEEQPKWVQDALYENDNDARSASRAIDLYKADMNISTKKSSNNKDAAKSVNTRNSRTKPDATSNNNKMSESTVNKMSSKEYEKHQDEIMEAIRGGNFIYDISGSAR